MIGLFMSLAIIAAIAAVGYRRWQRDRLKFKRPGTSIFEAIVVDGFDAIDAVVQEQRCGWCESRLAESGETSRNVADRRYRVVRLVCHECEREVVLFFDVTQVFH